jgi:hypothetical protein
MCSILQNKSLWQESNKKVHKQLEELNFLLSLCFVVLNVVIFNMATLTSGRNEKVICLLWLLSGSSPWEQICRKFSLFSLLLSLEICCLLSPNGSRELLCSLSYRLQRIVVFLSFWLQRIVVFSLLLALEYCCLLSSIFSRELLIVFSLLLVPEHCCLLFPNGSRELLASLS